MPGSSIAPAGSAKRVPPSIGPPLTGLPTREMLYHAGVIRLAQGDRDAGNTLVHRALSLNPHFDVLPAAEAPLLGEGPERHARRP